MIVSQSQLARESLILKVYKNKLLLPLSELLFQNCIMLEIRYELVMVNSSNLAFSNSLIRFMNKIPMSSLAITLRTMYCYPAIELRPRQKIFVPPQPKKRVTINIIYNPPGLYDRYDAHFNNRCNRRVGRIM